MCDVLICFTSGVGNLLDGQVRSRAAPAVRADHATGSSQALNGGASVVVRADAPLSLTIRPMRTDDLDAADAVMRQAFGTFFGMPDPADFMGDAGLVRTRWRADPTSAFVAELDGTLVGSGLANTWGRFGFVGPLTVSPGFWGRGIASQLMEPILGRFEDRGVAHVGLFTMANSPQHLHLYQKFDFWPGHLTALLGKPVEAGARSGGWQRYSVLSAGQRAESREACRALTDAICPGLDLGDEIDAVAARGLGETVLLTDDAGVAGFAVCHQGAGTEAGSDVSYVKFGAAAPGPGASARFDRLLDACEALAAEAGLKRLSGGANTGRHAAYRQMLARGFAPEFVGVAMHRRNAPAYNRPDVYVIDDWR